MEDRRVSQLLVTDAAGRLVGAVHIHDLLAAKVV
jgi:arabinose-5-phosphate isomerase